MTPLKLGYAGTGLYVDLSSGRIRREPLDRDWAARWLGGKGFGAALLPELLPAGTDPLSPENVLIFATGALTGTPAPCGGRFELCTKSPQTGLWLDSNCGGSFGPELKYAGYDFLVVSGRAAQPTVLVIKDEQVLLVPAGELWGQDTITTHRELKKEHGPETRVACIGPAGEKRVIYAGVISEYRALGRGGGGAVMGAKNLKAVAVKATGGLELADPESFMTYTAEAFNELSNNPDTGGGRRKYGTNVVLSCMEETGIHPVANFSKGVFEGAAKVNEETVAEYYERDRACFGCPINCSKIAKVKSGPYAGSFTEGPEYENTWVFGANCENTEIGAIIEAEYLCDYYGLDSISTGGVIGFLMECFDKGLVTEKDLGLELRFGDHEAMIKAVHLIGRQEGLGKSAGRGVKRLAREIPGSEKLAIHVKGMELPAYDPRGSTGIALAFATSDRGGCHLRSWPIGDEFMSAQDRLDPHSNEFKPELVKSQQDLFCVINSIGMCLFATFALSLRQMAPWMETATGIKSLGEPDRLLEAGERINNQVRLFNLREGLTPEMDDLPARFREEGLAEGPNRGMTVDVAEMRPDYYAVRGWDEDGRPTKEKLRQLGIGE